MIYKIKRNEKNGKVYIYELKSEKIDRRVYIYISDMVI